MSEKISLDSSVIKSKTNRLIFIGKIHYLNLVINAK